MYPGHFERHGFKRALSTCSNRQTSLNMLATRSNRSSTVLMVVVSVTEEHNRIKPDWSSNCTISITQFIMPWYRVNVHFISLWNEYRVSAKNAFTLSTADAHCISRTVSTVVFLAAFVSGGEIWTILMGEDWLLSMTRKYGLGGCPLLSYLNV